MFFTPGLSLHRCQRFLLFGNKFQKLLPTVSFLRLKNKTKTFLILIFFCCSNLNRKEARVILLLFWIETTRNNPNKEICHLFLDFSNRLLQRKKFGDFFERVVYLSIREKTENSWNTYLRFSMVKILWFAMQNDHRVLYQLFKKR